MKFVVGMTRGCVLLALALAPTQACALEWQRVEALPAADIETVRRVDGTLYVGGADRVFIAEESGNSWSATAPLGAGGAPIFTVLPAGGALWAAAFGVGVFRSTDGGQHWAPVNTGLAGLGALHVAQFALKESRLYAATLGAGVFRLELADPTRWSAFNDGLPVSIAGNVSTIVLAGTTLQAAAGGNGYVYRFPQGALEWQETSVRPPILPGFVATDLAGDGTNLLVASGTSVYRSVDDGQTWTPADTGLPNGSGVFLAYSSGATFLAMVDFLNNTHRLYITSDAGASWQPMEETADAVVYEIEVAGGRIWAARTDGLWWTPFITPVRRTSWSLLKGGAGGP